METIKYIVKRLLLSVFILLGVSVIIYALARMMPVNYVEQQFLPAISQGTMKQEDLDRILDLYGLSMPDAYLSVTVGEGSAFSGVKFQKNAKELDYEEKVKKGILQYGDWYTGSYTASGDRELRISAPTRAKFELKGAEVTVILNGNTLQVESTNPSVIPYMTMSLSGNTTAKGSFKAMDWSGTTTGRVFTFNFGNDNVLSYTINTNGTPESGTVAFRDGGVVELGKVASVSIEQVEGEDGEEGDGEKEDTSGLVFKEQFDVQESGIYYIEKTDAGLESIRNLEIYSLINADDVRLGDMAANVNYRVATFGDKAKAVLKSYFNWLGNLFKGDLGVSFKYKRPVGQVIVQNMGISFAIAFVATILQFLIAIPLGIKAAVHQYGFVDYSVTILTMMGISLPTFFFAAILIRLFSVGLGWFPPSGIANAAITGGALHFFDVIWHMILPLVVLVVLSIGGLMRYTRTNTLEALSADYVRTARAKGLSEKAVIYKHAFRNTMVPLVTMLAGILPSLFSGAMITETVFAIPGIGNMAYEALKVADVPFIMGYNMFLAILTVLGTLLSDLMYAVVDPRVKIGK